MPLPQIRSTYDNQNIQFSLIKLVWTLFLWLGLIVQCSVFIHRLHKWCILCHVLVMRRLLVYPVCIRSTLMHFPFFFLFFFFLPFLRVIGINKNLSKDTNYFSIFRTKAPSSQVRLYFFEYENVLQIPAFNEIGSHQMKYRWTHHSEYNTVSY